MGVGSFERCLDGPPQDQSLVQSTRRSSIESFADPRRLSIIAREQAQNSHLANQVPKKIAHEALTAQGVRVKGQKVKKTTFVLAGDQLSCFDTNSLTQRMSQGKEPRMLKYFNLKSTAFHSPSLHPILSTDPGLQATSGDLRSVDGPLFFALDDMKTYQIWSQKIKEATKDILERTGRSKSSRRGSKGRSRSRSKDRSRSRDRSQNRKQSSRTQVLRQHAQDNDKATSPSSNRIMHSSQRLDNAVTPIGITPRLGTPVSSSKQVVNVSRTASRNSKPSRPLLTALKDKGGQGSTMNLQPSSRSPQPIIRASSVRDSESRSRSRGRQVRFLGDQQKQMSAQDMKSSSLRKGRMQSTGKSLRQLQREWEIGSKVVANFASMGWKPATITRIIWDKHKYEEKLEVTAIGSGTKKSCNRYNKSVIRPYIDAGVGLQPTSIAQN